MVLSYRYYSNIRLLNLSDNPHFNFNLQVVDKWVLAIFITIRI